MSKDRDLKLVDFSNHPKSVTEIKSDKSNDARDSTARDNLISMLRDIDSGKAKPDALCIIWRERYTEDGDDRVRSGHMVAGPEGHTTIGMVYEFLANYAKKDH